MYKSMENELSTNSTKTDSTISCEVFTSFESLEGIQKEWDCFVESVGGEIFLTYDWCRIWWKYYGKNRDLKVFIFRNNGKLVGIIPLFFERIWLGPVSVRAAKIVGSDFTLTQSSPPLADGYVRPVVKKFYELVSKDNCDIIHIGPLAGLYNHCDELKSSLTEFFGNSHSVLIESKTVQTYFHLPNNWEDYISSLGRKERRNIRSHYRLLSKLLGNDTYQVDSDFVTEEKFDEEFDKFVLMHQNHWNKLGKGGHFYDWPNSIEFHRELAKIQSKRDRLRFLMCSIKNHCLGYEYYYKCGNKYLGIVTAHSDLPELRYISLGKITFSELVKRSISEKIFCVDSMRGRYEYKLDLGGKLFQIKSICVIPRKISVRLRVYLFRLCARLLNLCYYKIWFGRLAPKLPFKRRPLWKLWIRTRL